MEARFVVEEGPQIGNAFVLQEGETKHIGAGPGVEMKLTGRGVSPRHAAFRLEPGNLLAVDLGGGILLNDAPIEPNRPVPLHAGDGLSIGECVLRVDLVGAAATDVRSEPRTLRLQTPLIPADEFELLWKLGSGATGTVHAALRRADGRRVAIKILRDELEPGSRDHERFLRESTLGSRVRSPYVVEVLDHRVTEKRAMIVLALVEGPSAADCSKFGPLPVPEAMRIAEDAAWALAAAAAEGIVHRDVKPSNILISPQGVAKLTDFGVAKSLNHTMQSLTASGQGLGTLAYLPPEQICEAKHVDPRADIYSLGASLFHLLAGRPPFEATTVQSLVDMAEQPPPPLGAARPDTPPGLQELVHATLEKEPSDRPPNARQVAEALRAMRERHYPGYDLSSLFSGQGHPR